MSRSITRRTPATLLIAFTIGVRKFSYCNLPVTVTVPRCTEAVIFDYEPVPVRSNLRLIVFKSSLSDTSFLPNMVQSSGFKSATPHKANGVRKGNRPNGHGWSVEEDFPSTVQVTP